MQIKNPKCRETIFGGTNRVMGMIFCLPPFQIPALVLSSFACSCLHWQAQTLVRSDSAEPFNCYKSLVTMEAV